MRKSFTFAEKGEKMGNKDEVKITTRDKLMRAWHNSMELTRDFEKYSKEIEDNKVKSVFSQFAEEEAVHSSMLRELLLSHQNNQDNQQCSL